MRVNVLPSQNYTRDMADAAEHAKSVENPCSRESRLGVKGGKIVLNFTLEASGAAPHLSDPETHRDGGFYIISRGGRAAGHGERLLHRMKHNSHSDSVAWKIKSGDNSCEFGPQPRNPAQFYKQVLRRRMLTGSGSTMSL